MSLEELLHFLPAAAALGSGRTSGAGSTGTGAATRPHRWGVGWVAVPACRPGRAFRVAFTQASESSESPSSVQWRLEALRVRHDEDDEDEADDTNNNKKARLRLTVQHSVPVSPPAPPPMPSSSGGLLLPPPVQVGVHHLCASDDASAVAVAWSDGSLQLYRCANAPNHNDDAAALELQWSLPLAHAGPIRSVFFVGDGSRRAHLVVACDAAAGDGGLVAYPDADRADSPPSPHVLVSGPCTAAAARPEVRPRTTSPAASKATILAVGDGASGLVRLYRLLGQQPQPTLEMIRSLDCPVEDGEDGPSPTVSSSGFRCTHLRWVSDRTLIAGYGKVVVDDQDAANDDDDDDDDDDSAEHVAELCVLHLAPDLALDRADALGDVVPFFAVPKRGRHAFLTAIVAPSRRPILAFVAANVGTDVAVLASSSDAANAAEPSTPQWSVLDIPDGRGIMTPTDKATDEFYYPTGLAVVPVPLTSLSDDIINNVNNDSSHETVMASFALLLACTDGSLSAFELRHDDDDSYFLAEVPRRPPAATVSAATPTITTTGAVPAPASLPTTPTLLQEATTAAAAATAPTSSPSSPADLGSASTTAPMLVAGAPIRLGPGTSTLVFGSGTSAPDIGLGTAAPVFGSGTSTLVFESGTSAAGIGLGTAAPVFGAPSALGSAAKTPPSSKQESPTRSGAGASAAGGLGSTTIFGSGSSTPTFGSGTSFPNFGASGFGSLVSPSFGAFASQAASKSGADSPFNLFTSSSSSAAAASMAKPLFGPSPEPSIAVSVAPVTTPTTESSSAQAKASGSAAPVVASPSHPVNAPAATSTELKSVSPATAVATAATEPTTSTGAAVPEESDTAKLAAQVFDALDTEGAKRLPASKMEALLDEIGEGFHGEELDAQVAKIDVDGTGYLERAAFVAWYEKLVLGDSGEDESSASDDDSERREEEENAREAFMKLATATAKDGGTSNSLEAYQFPDLLESMGTTYCEESHARIARRLTKDGKIDVDDFVQWYVQWVFEDEQSDEDSDDNDDRDDGDQSTAARGSSSAAAVSGWGDIFKTNEELWKCGTCMVSNKVSAVKCVACEAPRPGYEGPLPDAAPAAVAPAGSKGFSFGFAAVSTSPSQPSQGAPGGFSFGFSGVASSESVPAPTVAASSSQGTSSFTFGLPLTQPGGAATTSTETAGSKSNSPSFRLDSASTTPPANIPKLDSPAPVPATSGFTFGLSNLSSVDSASAPASDKAKKQTIISAYPPTTSKAPKPFGSESATSAAVKAPSLSAPKSSAYPPMMSKAPKPFSFSASESTSKDESKVKAKDESNVKASSSYPPMASKAQQPFSFASSAPTHASESTAYPPITSKAPVPFSGADSKPTAQTTASAGYPPLGSKAPLPSGSPSTSRFGDHSGKLDTTLTAPGYPPIASKAPKPFSFASTSASKDGNVFGQVQSTLGSATVGPKAPAPLKSGSELLSEQDSSKSRSSIYPPTTSKSPEPFSFSATAASTSQALTSTRSSSGYPPLASKAPTPHGSSEPKSTMAIASQGKQSTAPPIAVSSMSSLGQQEKTKSSSYSTESGYPVTVLDRNSSQRTIAHPSGIVGSPPESSQVRGRLLEPPRAIELSETSRQLVSLARSMKDRAKVLKSAYKTEPNDPYSVDIERVSAGVRGIVVALTDVESALYNSKDRAVTVIRSKALSQRHYAQAQQLITKMSESGGDIASDVVRQQPLDADSEDLRRQLASKAKLANVYASILESRCRTLEEADLPKALLRRVLETHDDVKGFQVVSERTATIVGNLESQMVSKRSTRSIVPASTRSSRRLPARPLPWGDVEEKFQTLPTPDVAMIDLPSTASLDRFTPKREQASLLTRTLAEPGQSFRSPPVLSPPLSLTCRGGWDAPSSTVMSKPSFEMPRTLRETTFDDAASGALASSGVSPDKLSDVINRARQGPSSMPSHVSPGPSSRSPKREARSGSSEGAKEPPPHLPPKGAASRTSLSPKADKTSFTSPSMSLLSSIGGGKPSLDRGGTGDKAGASSASTGSPSSFGFALGSGQQPSGSKQDSRARDASGAFGLGDLGASLGSTFAESTSSPVAESHPGDGSGEPNYQAILIDFYENHNPGKLSEVPKTLQRYKGREHEMFEKLAQRYRVANPLAAASGKPSSSLSTAPVLPGLPASAPSPSTFGISSPSQSPSPFSQAAPSSGQSPFGGATSSTTSASPFGGSTGTFGSSGMSSSSSSSSSSPSPFGQPFPQQPSPFGATMTPTPVSTPFSQGSPSPFSSPAGAAAAGPSGGGKPPLMLGGRTPRDILLQFYQQHNPSKVGEVDRLLAKYQGNEEQLFRNLAKRYNLDPTMFGLSSTPTFGSTPAPAGPSGFGQSSALGFAGATTGTPVSSPFGTGAPGPSPSFGSPFGASSPGFGQASSLGGMGSSGGVGGGGGGAFGSSAGAVPAASFGALASSTGGFGAGGFGAGGFAGTPSPFSAPGAPTAAAAFGGSPSPFGAPRR